MPNPIQTSEEHLKFAADKIRDAAQDAACELMKSGKCNGASALANTVLALADISAESVREIAGISNITLTDSQLRDISARIRLAVLTEIKAAAVGEISRRCN